MDDWLESEEVLKFFKYKTDDTIENIDRYVTQTINLTGGTGYIFNLLKKWESIVFDDTYDPENYDIIFKYFSTYIKLYVVDDIWNKFYKEFIPLLKEMKRAHNNCLNTLLLILDKEDIREFCKHFYNHSYSLYNTISSDDNSIGLYNSKTQLLYFIKEFICSENEYVIEIIREFNYELSNPVLNPYPFQDGDYNLINLAYLLPDLNSSNYTIDIDYLNNITKFMLKKRFKKYLLEYYSNILGKYNYRVKDFYNMSSRRDKKIDKFMINFMNIMLKLWDGGRRLHSSRIGDINSSYLYHDNCVLIDIINEATLVNRDIIIDEFPEKYDFLTECFYLTHRFVYLALYPLIKVFYKIKYKISELKSVVDNYLKLFGTYEEIPLLERSVYNRMKGSLSYYNIEYEKILTIMKSENISIIVPKLCEDTALILMNMKRDNLKLYEVFPESILDFVVEYSHFSSSIFEIPLELPKLMEFIIDVVCDKKLIINPYVRYKLFDLISINRLTINYILSTILCKRTIIKNVIQLYIDADCVSSARILRDRINFFTIRALNHSEDYKYALTTISEDRKIVEYFYLVLSELLQNYDTLLRNINLIYNTRDDDDFMLRSDYNLRLKSALVYTINGFTLITIILGISKTRKYFFKQELLVKLINFIYYVFHQYDKNEVSINYYNEKYNIEGSRKIKSKFDKIFTFCYSIYKVLGLNEKIDFTKIAEKTSSFFNKKLMLKYIEYTLGEGILDWVSYDIIVEMLDTMEREIKNSLEDIEVPDEFLDPIMSTPIEEAVMLPENDIIMDLSVISTHLLSNKTNPFTRSLLTIEDLKEYNLREDIRKKVDDFNNKFKKWREDNVIHV